MPPFATPDFESATCATPVLVKKMTNFIEKNEQKRSEPGGPNGFLTCDKININIEFLIGIVVIVLFILIYIYITYFKTKSSNDLLPVPKDLSLIWVLP